MISIVEPPLLVWKQFQEDRPVRAAEKHRFVLSAWQRSRGYGVDAVGTHHTVGVSGAELVKRRDSAEALIAEGNAALERMSAELATENVIGVLADQDGVVLHTSGGFKEGALRARLVDGAKWDERSRGTNAIGTAIALKEDIAVHGRAHYARDIHGLFCYASPIRDVLGRVLAVFDVTGPRDRDNSLFALAVRSTALSVEHAIRLRSYAQALPGGFRVLEGMLERCATPALIVESPGIVRRVNERLLRAMALPREHCEGLSIERLFGLPYETLRDEALMPRRSYVSVATDTLQGHAEIEPVIGADGSVFALVLYIDVDKAVVHHSTNVAARKATAADAFDRILGSDPQVSLARASAALLAGEEEPLLIVSEPKQGEAALARAIHQASHRADGPFVTVDGRMTSQDDLFGEDGAYHRARGGTLFLAFANELGRQAQTALFQCLEQGSYSVAFGSPQVRSQARLVAHIAPAMSRRTTELQKHSWHERFAGHTLTLPALAERVDKVELAEGLLRRVCGERPPEFGSSARAWLSEQAWPSDLDTLEQVLADAADRVGAAGVIDAAVLSEITPREIIREKSAPRAKRPAR